MEDLQQTTRKRMASEISPNSTLQTTAPFSPNKCDSSQEYCFHCNKTFEIKLCACKCRIQCVHCKSWWMKLCENSELDSVKRRRLNESTHEKLKLEIQGLGINPLDQFHDYLLSYLLSKVGETGTSPHDLLNLRLVCKRFKDCMDPWGLANMSGKIIYWLHAHWSEQGARDFLTRGADVGNPEACYFLGMISYYCMDDQTRGASLIEKAAKGGHAAAFYSLAVMHFRNDESDKVLKCKGSSNCTHYVCTKWAKLGRLDALREMGFNVESDPHFSSPSNLYALRECTLEKMAQMDGKTHEHNCHYHRKSVLKRLGFDWGLEKEVLEARKVIDEYLDSDPRNGWDERLKMCSNLFCGRKERIGNEFTRCNSCEIVYYCSNVCQEMHFRMKHYEQCGSK